MAYQDNVGGPFGDSGCDIVDFHMEAECSACEFIDDIDGIITGSEFSWICPKCDYENTTTVSIED